MMHGAYSVKKKRHITLEYDFMVPAGHFDYAASNSNKEQDDTKAGIGKGAKLKLMGLPDIFPDVKSRTIKPPR